MSNNRHVPSAGCSSHYRTLVHKTSVKLVKPLALRCEELHLNLRNIPAARSLSHPHLEPSVLSSWCFQVLRCASSLHASSLHPILGTTLSFWQRGVYEESLGLIPTHRRWLTDDTHGVFIIMHLIAQCVKHNVCPAAVLDTFSTKQIPFGAIVLICLISIHFLSFLTGIRDTVPMGNAGVDFSFEKILQEALLSKGFYKLNLKLSKKNMF